MVVCSGWSKVTWKSPHNPSLEGVAVEDRGSTSVLVLHNVTWRHSGNYVCEEPSTEETKDISVFEWFVPLQPALVMKEREEGTIPCVVSDPSINVTLYERASKDPVEGTYDPSKGFTAILKDSSYICRGAMNGEEKASQVYYVYSIVVPKSMNAFMTLSKTVLKQGEALMVNCTVEDAEIVYFKWDFPRKEMIEPLTDFLTGNREFRIRSFLNISSATLEDSGQYICRVQDTVSGQSAMDNLTVTVLERGFVALEPSINHNVSALQFESIELTVQIEAYPKPQVLWTRDNTTLTGETVSMVTRQVHETSYLSTLTLVRVRMEQRGLYTVHVANEDEVKEITFDLQVKDLSDQHMDQGHGVLCVTEGVPTPTIHWYSCESIGKCSNKTTAWKPLSADPENVSIQMNVSYIEASGVNHVRSLLTFQTMGSITSVRCEARNEKGRRAWDIKLVSNSLFSQVAVLAAVLTLVVIAVIFLIILIALWRKKPRYEIRWKVIESVSSDGHAYTYMDPMDLPYDCAWEVPRDNLVLGHTLGSGAFGRVVEATTYGLGHSQSTTKVAVKMLNESDGGYMDMTKEDSLNYVPMQELSDNIKYADIEPSRADVALSISDSPILSYTDLVGFSYQVAKGMDFLASKNRGYRMPKPTHATDEIYDVMCKCWDEKFEKRPPFSSLVHLMGNLLTDVYKKKYTQVNESFLKSDRSKPTPVGNPAVSPDVQSSGDRAGQETEETEETGEIGETGKEAGPSQTDYIIAIPDIHVVEEAEASGEVLDTATQSTSSPPSTTDQTDTDTASLNGPEASLEEPVPTEEEVPAPTQEDKLPQSPCTPEVEESFL
ncbi:unnamed protein product, partial [Coregonus sp. 'balchen']